MLMQIIGFRFMAIEQVDAIYLFIAILLPPGELSICVTEISCRFNYKAIPYQQLNSFVPAIVPP